MNNDNFEDHCWEELLTDEMRKVYAPYQRATYVGSHAAILAIDLYQQVFEGGPVPVVEAAERFPSSCGLYAWNALKPLQRLLKVGRSAKVPIIYTTGPPTSSGLAATNRTSGRTKRPDAYTIMPQLSPTSVDLVIMKERASAFFGTALIAHLIRMGIRTLIVCGESTSGCVRASVVDAYSYGFHTVVAEECCFDRSSLSHKVTLFDLHHKYADVFHLEDVIDYLNQLAGKEE